MATQKFQKKKIQETQKSGFGSYSEGVGGGGSPEAKDPNKRAPGVNSNYRKNNNNTMQPRTNDGKFTYKSVNGQSIDPKYGPSRGETVNPLLTGGENGVKIADVENEFASQSGAYWNKYKDKWYQKGGEVVTGGDFKVRVAAEAIWNIAKRKYDSVKGEFEKESSTFAEVKKGRSGAEEQAAKKQAKSTGEESAVIGQSTGGIKIKPGTQIPQRLPTPQPSVGSQPMGQQPVGQQPSSQPQTGSIPNAVAPLKHTKAQLDTARQMLIDNGVDLTGVTDEQLDGIVDEYFDFNAVSTGDNQSSSAPASEESKEESEATKKIKQMGFSDGK